MRERSKGGLNRPVRGRELWVLIAIIAASVALRVAVLRIDRVVRWDEPDYLMAGRSLCTGQGYAVSGMPELHYAPLSSIAAGLLYPVTHDMKLNSDICFVVFGTLALLPLYGLARRLFGARTAAVATAFACVFPPLTASVPFWGTMLEPLYMLLIYSAMYAVWRAWEGQSPVPYLAAGVLFGLAYLTKPEAIVYFGWMFALLVLANIGRRSLAKHHVLVGIAGGILAFALVLSPYLAFLYKHTGRIMLSGKLGVTYVAGQGAVDHDPGLYDRALAQLDEAGEEIIWFSPDRFKYNVWEYIKADPRAFVLRVWKNVNTLESMLFNRRVFSYYFLCLVALAWFGSAWDRRRAIKECFLLASALPVFVFLPFHIELRYFAPLLPLLLLWLARGIGTLAEWLGQTWAGVASDARQSSALSRGSYVLLGTLVLLYFLALQPRVVSQGLAGMGTTRRDVGLWLRENSAADAMIMSRDTEVPFYAERRWSATPNEEYPIFAAYIRKRGADYLVIDEREAQVIRPQLSHLLDETTPPEGLRHVYTARDDKGKTVVYEVLY